MSLAITYCKEIIRELKQIPVYIPGREVNIGDVIMFTKNKRKPIGDFTRYVNLKDLDIDIETTKDKSPDPITFSSRRSVSFDFSANADAGGAGKGSLQVKFSKEGSTYLTGANIVMEEATNLLKLKEDLMAHRDKLDWIDYFIVVGVTRAEKALIMQSSSNSAELGLEGDVKALTPGNPSGLDTGLKFAVNKSKDAAFLKDWADDVAIFFRVVKYKAKRNRLEMMSGQNYHLEEVDVDDLLNANDN